MYRSHHHHRHRADARIMQGRGGGSGILIWCSGSPFSPPPVRDRLHAMFCQMIMIVIVIIINDSNIDRYLVIMINDSNIDRYLVIIINVYIYILYVSMYIGV